MPHNAVRLATLAMLAAVALTTGCKSKNPAPIETGVQDPVATSTDSTGFGDRGTSLDTSGLPYNVDLGNTQWTTDANLRPIYFDYDSYSIRASEHASLRHNAQYLMGRSGYVQIAGHSDERGTQEYNLALGERRALAVRNYLIQLGVPGDRIITISYGEESPASPGSSEEAWALNRRAETLVSVQ